MPDLEKGLIGQKVLPITSAHRAGRYPRLRMTAGELLKAGGDKRAPSGTYNRTDRKWEWDTFDTEDRGSEEAIDDTLVKEMDQFLDIEKTTTQARRSRQLAPVRDRRCQPGDEPVQQRFHFHQQRYGLH